MEIFYYVKCNKNQKKMQKIRKGSIVWDTLNKRKGKVLTSLGKGEVPDNVCEKTGESKHKLFKFVVLIADKEGFHRFNNKPCYIIRPENLIPYSKYLKSLN